MSNEIQAATKLNSTTRIDPIMHRLEQSVNVLCSKVNDMRVKLDTLCGSTPESEVTNGEAPEHTGSLGHIVDLCDSIGHQIERFKSELSRLEQG